MFGQGALQLLLRGGATLFILAACSVYSLAAILERILAYRRVAKHVAALRAEVEEALAAGKVAEARAACEARAGHPVAAVFAAGLAALQRALEGRFGLTPGPDLGATLEAIRGATARETADQIAGLERRLPSLATLGNVSPFIGLFGTVLGIIRAFEAIAATGAGGLAVVSAGIAEALVATAAGLFVAIPAVIAYNTFVGRVKAFAQEMDRAGQVVVEAALREATR
ncbi:MAG TPA: MotA/TolQ/ExbB proton channel family protein [Candidatus Methylomirabilis sp.]|jgi:biopolymer transport protein ExbB/TolQ|nr:MotA/TolQ/ExbB proton channel family protein [Candidatus Methylomirabilis sp.]